MVSARLNFSHLTNVACDTGMPLQKNVFGSLARLTRGFSIDNGFANVEPICDGIQTLISDEIAEHLQSLPDRWPEGFD